MVPETISVLDTPCLLLEKARVENNIRQMTTHIASLGASLRPHVKTNKSLDCTRMIFGGEAGPITVSTLKEAEYFFEGGFKDILYAVGIVPAKLPRVKKLMDAGADIKIILDSQQAADAVAAYGAEHEAEFRVFIEIDCDMHRAGLRPGDARVVTIAEFLAKTPGVQFAGIMTHAGESYACKSTDEIRVHANLERDGLLQARAAIESAGIDVPVASVGSTPTARFAENFDGIEEVRAGVFVFCDLFQRGLGVCNTEDIALSVLTSVIGHRADQNRLFIDAGALALSKDRGTSSQASDCLYGLVCDAGGNPIEGMIVEGVNQEHGIVTATSGALDFDRFPIGSLLRILPNHACMTEAAHSGYYVLDKSEEVEAFWERCHGW